MGRLDRFEEHLAGRFGSILCADRIVSCGQIEKYIVCRLGCTLRTGSGIILLVDWGVTRGQIG